MFEKMKDLVDAYKLFEMKENHEKESLSTIQCQFKIGLALCVSKNSKWLTSDQKLKITDWLNEQIEMYGGEEGELGQT